MKRLFFAAVLAVIFPACADFGSVDLALLYRLHPYTVFFYLPDTDGFISLKSLKNNEFSQASLAYVRRDFIANSEQGDNELKKELNTLIKEKQGIEIQRSDLVNQYRKTETGKPSSEQEKKYLALQSVLLKKLIEVGGKIDKIMKSFSAYSATQEEQKKIRKQIWTDINEGISKVKKAHQVERIIFYPGSINSAASVIYHINDLCALDKDSFTEQERQRFSYFMSQGFKFRLNSLTDRDKFIVYGGADYSLEILQGIFEKYKFASELQEMLVNALNKEEAR
ncbi:MAG: hypothetical protein PHW04_01385 [Candidatus Wallbacteria bacterium]|nr:hypothetical protein [Candidatus Wallbacteria bacterium]